MAPLAGPSILDGNITMNGLGNALRDVSSKLDQVTAALAALKAELDTVRSAQEAQQAIVLRIEQAVVPGPKVSRIDPNMTIPKLGSLG
jgi:hypothetical protein